LHIHSLPTRAFIHSIHLHLSIHPQLYTIETLMQRVELIDNPDVANALDRHWAAVAGGLRRKRGGVIYKDEFVELNKRLQKCTSEVFHESFADTMAKDDWERCTTEGEDGEPAEEMTYEQFKDQLFEVADLWCANPSADDYAMFLDELLEGVATRDQKVYDDTGREEFELKDLNSIVCIADELRAYTGIPPPGMEDEGDIEGEVEETGGEEGEETLEFKILGEGEGGGAGKKRQTTIVVGGSGTGPKYRVKSVHEIMHGAVARKSIVPFKVTEESLRREEILRTKEEQARRELRERWQQADRARSMEQRLAKTPVMAGAGRHGSITGAQFQNMIGSIKGDGMDSNSLHFSATAGTGAGGAVVAAMGDTLVGARSELDRRGEDGLDDGITQYKWARGPGNQYCLFKRVADTEQCYRTSKFCKQMEGGDELSKGQSFGDFDTIQEMAAEDAEHHQAKTTQYTFVKALTGCGGGYGGQTQMYGSQRDGNKDESGHVERFGWHGAVDACGWRRGYKTGLGGPSGNLRQPVELPNHLPASMLYPAGSCMGDKAGWAAVVEVPRSRLQHTHQYKPPKVTGEEVSMGEGRVLDGPDGRGGEEAENSMIASEAGFDLDDASTARVAASTVAASTVHSKRYGHSYIAPDSLAVEPATLEPWDELQGAPLTSSPKALKYTAGSAGWSATSYPKSPGLLEHASVTSPLSDGCTGRPVGDGKFYGGNSFADHSIADSLHSSSSYDRGFAGDSEMKKNRAIDKGFAAADKIIKGVTQGYAAFGPSMTRGRYPSGTTVYALDAVRTSASEAVLPSVASSARPLASMSAEFAVSQRVQACYAANQDDFDKRRQDLRRWQQRQRRLQDETKLKHREKAHRGVTQYDEWMHGTKYHSIATAAGDQFEDLPAEDPLVQADTQWCPAQTAGPALGARPVRIDSKGVVASYRHLYAALGHAAVDTELTRKVRQGLETRHYPLAVAQQQLPAARREFGYDGGAGGGAGAGFSLTRGKGVKTHDWERIRTKQNSNIGSPAEYKKKQAFAKAKAMGSSVMFVDRGYKHHKPNINGGSGGHGVRLMSGQFAPTMREDLALAANRLVNARIGAKPKTRLAPKTNQAGGRGRAARKKEKA
jgi:hypothetical protein